MKLSVVIPVYRVESTLDRCVESVLCQRVDDMEVILVDDGSPDDCPRMCDEWGRKDGRIRVIHKANGGLSDARNAGIDVAQGDYITFVDSDDWLEPDTYAPLLDGIGDADMLEYSVSGRTQLNNHVYTDINDYWLDSQAYQHCFAWNKIYRRRLFDAVRYPVGRVFEDVYTLPQLLNHCHRIVTTSRGTYHYEWNPAGITATADGTELALLLDAHLNSGMPVNDDYYLYMLNIQMDVWERTKSPLLLPKRKLNVSSFNGFRKLKAILLNTLGIKRLCKLNKLSHYIRKPSR